MELSGTNRNKWERLSKIVPKLIAKKSFFLHFRRFAVYIPATLIDFEQCVEVRVIVLNAVIFHPCGDEQIDPGMGRFASCLMDILKQLRLEAVADGFGQVLQSGQRHVVIVFHRLAGKRGNNDSYGGVGRYRCGLVVRLLGKVHVDHVRLLRATDRNHRSWETIDLTRTNIFIPVVNLCTLIGIPLRQIRRQRQLDKTIFHKIVKV